MVSAIAYMLLIAVPFVPGVEIGLTLIGVFGAADRLSGLRVHPDGTHVELPRRATDSP